MRPIDGPCRCVILPAIVLQTLCRFVGLPHKGASSMLGGSEWRQLACAVKDAGCGV